MNSLYGRIYRGISAGFIGQVVNVLGRLLLIPLFMNSWGAPLYGEWLIITSIVALLAMSDLGGQIYFVNRLTAEWSRNDKKGFQETLSTGMMLFLIFPTLCAVLLICVVVAVPIGPWLGITHIDSIDIQVLLLALSIQSIIALPQGLLLGIYRAIGLQATSIMIGNLILILQILSSGLALLLGAEPVTIAWLQILPVLTICTLVVHDLRSRIPSLRLTGIKYFSIGVARESLRPSLEFMFIQLSQLSMQQGTVIIVGRLLGPVEVVIFSTIRTIVNSLKQVLGLLSHSAWPEFTRLEACRNGVDLEKLFYVVLILSMTSAFIMVGILEIGGEYFVKFWLRGKLDYPHEILHYFCIYILLSIFATLTSNVLMATNRHRVLAKWQMMIAIITLIAFYVGINLKGLTGGVAALILAEALPAYIVFAWILQFQLIGIRSLKLAHASLYIVFLISLFWIWPIIGSVFALFFLFIWFTYIK